MQYNRKSIGLSPQNYQRLIRQFKQRQQSTSLQQALVYLKLRQHNCDKNKALIFAKKKQRGTDGTIDRDGPSDCRKLQVVPPQSKLVNGWLKGQKHKYVGTTGYVDSMLHTQSTQKQQITKYNQKQRRQQDAQRIMRSRSNVYVNLSQPKETIQRISSIKQDLGRQRQNRNMYVQYKGARMEQTTKHFFRNTQGLQTQGLVVKLEAFGDIMTNPGVALEVDVTNIKGKTLSVNEVEAQKKRDVLIKYKKVIEEDRGEVSNNINRGSVVNSIATSNTNQIKGTKIDNNWQKLIQRKRNDKKSLNFGRGSLDAAGNALILTHTRQLKGALESNQKKFGQTVTRYSNFYRDMNKAVGLQFLEKRYSMPNFRKVSKAIN